MVVAMQELTSLSPSGTTPAGLEARQGASLALPSAGEPLNPTAGIKASLSPAGFGEGKSHPGFRPGEPNRLRVPVVDARGMPLIRCTPARARLLLKNGKALARRNKLGVFYIKLKYAVEPKNQILAVGVGGVRKRYGGTVSLGLKKGTLVEHVKYGLCYVGGNLRGRFSLHSLKTGKRLTQDARREDFKILTRIAFRTQFLSATEVGSFLG
jgi:hypothetical protein